MLEQLHHLRDRQDTAFWVEQISIAYRSLELDEGSAPAPVATPQAFHTRLPW